MKTYGVVMAGGGGTRFWPLSRKESPKQLLNLSGKEIMVNETIDRLSQVIARDDIYIVTNTAQTQKMREMTNERILSNHILPEPSARNTAACIGYAAIKIIKAHGDGVMVITPSDAYIKNSKEYANVLRKAVAEAEVSDNLITIGITPTFPATGYGYIRFKKAQNDIKDVLQFVEKPDLETAKKYFEIGEYVWNSGIFVWKVSVILKKFKELLPDIYESLNRLADSFGTTDEEKVLNDIYPKMQSISIDYGILEKSSDIKVIPSEFGWSDVGSWDMLGVLHEADTDGNISVGNVLPVDTKNCIIYSNDKLIATVGIENLIVVATADAVMVCRKDNAQDVKKIVEALKTQKKEELL